MRMCGKHGKTAGFESSILSLCFCSLSLGVVDWFGLLLPVTVHLLSFVCMWQSLCGMGWVQVRLRVEEREFCGCSCFGFFSVSSGSESYFFIVIFIYHSLPGFPPKLLPKAWFVGRSSPSETSHFLVEANNWSTFGSACVGIENII